MDADAVPVAPAEGRRGENPPAVGGDQLSQHAIRGFLWLLSTSAAQAVVQIATLMLLARLLGPTAFGIVGGALLVIRVADVVSKLGVGQALVQRKELDDRHTAAALLFFTGWGILVSLVLIATAPLQADLLRIPELRQIVPVMALGVLVSNFAEVSVALLRRGLRFRVLALWQAISYSVAYGLVAVGLALLGFGLWALVWAFVAQMVVKTVALNIAAPHAWSLRATPAALRDLLAFGGGMTSWRLAIQAAQECDNLVVARMLGAEALGLYRRAYQFSVTPAAFFAKSMATIVFPVASRLREPERLARAYLLAVAGVSLVGLPVGVFLAVVAPEFVRVVLGAEWAAAAPPLAVLSLGLVFHLNQQVAGSIAAASGAVYRIAWRHTIFAVAVLVGALIGLAWGLVGVAFGVLAALLFNYLLMGKLILTLTGMRWRDLLRAHASALLLTLVVGATALAVRWTATELRLPPLAVLAACAVAAVIATALAVRIAPRRLLGTHGIWWLERLLKAMPRRHGRVLARLLGFPLAAGATAAAEVVRPPS